MPVLECTLCTLPVENPMPDFCLAMSLFIRRFLTSLSIFLLSTFSAFACLDQQNPAPNQVSDALYVHFVDELKAMQMEPFVVRYCGLTAADRTLALRIFGSAYEGKEEEEQFTLLRMAIMVPDIAENVTWVAQNARIREDGEDWESVSIKRFVKHVRTRFPASQTVLDDAYIASVNALYKSAVEAIHSNESAADRKISQANKQIADYEKKINELKWQIEALKDERRDYLVMRQTLEAEQ